MDEEFRNPRLAGIYDVMDPDRSDLDGYLAIARELHAERVLDVGCGTGTFAVMLAEHGYEVVGVDPAAASRAVARAKPGASPVRWIDGDATDLDVHGMDLAVLTANAAQSIADPSLWQATLLGIHRALRPDGYLVFETRDPAAQAWHRWTPEHTYRTVNSPSVGTVTSWCEVTAVDWPLVHGRWTWQFASDGATLTSDMALCFRERDEVESDLRRACFTVLDVRDAPDRPGKEFVFVATTKEVATKM